MTPPSAAGGDAAPHRPAAPAAGIRRAAPPVRGARGRDPPRRAAGSAAPATGVRATIPSFSPLDPLPPPNGGSVGSGPSFSPLGRGGAPSGALLGVWTWRLACRRRRPAPRARMTRTAPAPGSEVVRMRADHVRPREPGPARPWLARRARITVVPVAAIAAGNGGVTVRVSSPPLANANDCRGPLVRPYRSRAVGVGASSRSRRRLTPRRRLHDRRARPDQSRAGPPAHDRGRPGR